jgi:hypothetical protein
VNHDSISGLSLSACLISVSTGQHVRQQESRRMFEMKRLEKLKQDLELRAKAEQQKLSKKMRWRQAMDQVDRKIADMKVSCHIRAGRSCGQEIASPSGHFVGALVHPKARVC